MPAARTVKYIRATHRKRVTPLLLDALWQHATAHAAARAHPCRMATDHEEQCSAWAWLMPTLLLRTPAAQGLTRKQLGEALDARLMMAELGNWHQLLEHYILEHFGDQLEQQRQAQMEQHTTEGMQMQRASAKMDCGAVRQARNALEGGGRAPPTQVTLEEIERLIAVATGEAEREATSEACNMAVERSSKQQGPSTEGIKRLCRELSKGAEPGPSGWRNADIAWVCRENQGPQTLKMWMQQWHSGTTSEFTRQLWSSALVTPLDCGEKKQTEEEKAQQHGPAPRKLRPIALSEPLVKLTESAAVEADLERLLKHTEPKNMGIGTPDGAALIVRVLRGAGAAYASQAGTKEDWEYADGPGCILPVDLENAYCRAYRSRMVHAGLEVCPAVTACAAAQWKGEGSTTAWVACEGEWRPLQCRRGSWQGSRLSQALFVCSLEDAQDRAEAETRRQEHESTRQGGPFVPEAAPAQHVSRARVALQDDTTHVGRAAALLRLWPNLQKELERAGHRLRPPKCACWFPGYDEVASTALPQSAKELLDLVPRQCGGVEILGSTATAQHAMHAGCHIVAPAATAKRTQAACDLIDKIVAFAQAQVDYKSFAKAWSLLSKCAGSALDYDMRVLPPAVVMPYCKQLEAKLRGAMERILGEPLSLAQWHQCALPTTFGGMALRAAAPERQAMASYWCSVDAHFAVMPAIAHALQMPQAARHPEVAFAEQAREALLEAGVAVQWGGGIAIMDAQKAEYQATPWNQDLPVEKLTQALPKRRDPAPSMVQLGTFDRYLSRVCRALEGGEAAKFWQAADTAGRANILTGGGPGTGITFTRVSRSPHELLPNAHWRQSVLSRLDTKPIFGGKRCNLRHNNEGEEKACGTPLATNPRHSELCKRGAARNRAHRHLEGALVHACAAIGLVADTERFIPELYQLLSGKEGCTERVKKAIMDVVIGAPGIESHLLCDVSIRSVAASRYSSSSTAGHAAQVGEREKRTRYGSAVLPVVFECGGRIGPASLESLNSIVALAATARLCHPNSVTSWRARCERAVLFATADAALRASGACAA